VLKKFQGPYSILESCPKFRTFKIQNCETKKIHQSLIHANRLRLCDNNREKLYSRLFVPATEVELELKCHRQSRVVNAESSVSAAARQEKIDSESDGETDRPNAQLADSSAAGQHSLHRPLPTTREEGTIEERDSTPTSQTQTTTAASRQQNIASSEESTADQREKTQRFQTQIIFPTG